MILALSESFVGAALDADALVRRLLSLEMLKPLFARDLVWSDDAVAAVREEVPGFRRPAEVVAAFADTMVTRGLMAGRGRGSGRRWQLDFMAAHRLKEREAAAEAARPRERELDGAVLNLAKALGEPFSAALEGWSDAPLPGGGGSPREIARSGADEWSRLRRAIEALTVMAAPEGKPVPEMALLGLPLSGLRAAREREEEERRAAWERQRDEERRQAAERRKADSLAFVDRALTDACLLLGRERGEAWLTAAVARRVEGASEEARGRLGPFEIRAVQEDLDALHDRVERQHEAEDRRRLAEGIAAQAVTDRRERLGRKALQANRGNAEMAELWIRGRHPALGCSPWDACATEAGYGRADALLDGIIRGGARRR